jgi:type I restriction enzyme S subunit
MMFYKETDFQDSPIGKLPNNWALAKFGETCVYYKGKKPDETAEEYSKDYLPYLSAECLRKNRTAKFAKLTENVVLVNDDDLLLLWDGSNAGEFFLGRKGVLSSTMVRIALKEERYDVKFLFYLLKMREQYLKGQTKGTGIPHVDGNVLDNLVIPLPSFEEQRAVVEVLGVVDSAIGLVDEVIAKTEHLKKGLMQTLLTKGIGHTEYKDTPIGKTPKTWQTVKLGEVLELCQYGLSVKLGDKGKYRILKMDDIVNGVAVPNNAKYVDLDEATFNNFRLEKRDILFNRTNSYELVGRTGIFLLDGDYTFASYLIRLRPKNEIVDSQFLTYYMVFSNNRLRQLATRAVHQANINATNLQSYTVPLPPLSEQKQIEEILVTLDKKLELERKEKMRLEKVKRGLMDLLLTGKVRVKVD